MSQKLRLREKIYRRIGLMVPEETLAGELDGISLVVKICANAEPVGRRASFYFDVSTQSIDSRSMERGCLRARNERDYLHGKRDRKVHTVEVRIDAKDESIAFALALEDCRYAFIHDVKESPLAND